MKFFPVNYFRQIIVDEISLTIHLHREFKESVSYFEYYFPVSDNEVDDFIISTPYYSVQLKEFLRNRLMLGIVVHNEWIHLFIKSTCKWAESDEWLYHDVSGTPRPGLNPARRRIPLDLPPKARILELWDSYLVK